MEEEDMEEMKYLRDINKKLKGIEERKVTGYKFELKSSKPKVTNTIGNMPGLKSETVVMPTTEEEDELTKVMGFSGFGREKKSDKNEKTAMKFDIEKMMQERTSKLKIETKQEEEESDSEESSSSSKDTRVVEKKVEDEDESDDDLIGPPLPPGFGQEEDNKVKNAANDSDEEDSDSDYEEDDEGSRYDSIPSSHEIELTHGAKSVTALAIDPNGSRLVSGGVDYEMRFWDFQGMDSNLQSFRAITPCESHPIKNLEFSTNGDVVLVISGACIAKIVDRDGFVKGETVKGDQYISDMSHTKGHIATLNDGTWHPRDKEIFVTCADDGTIRLWNINDLKKQKSVIKPRSSGGLRAAPNTCRFTRDSATIAAGCNDGSIQMWDTRRGFVNTSNIVRDAHVKGSEVSCIQFSYDAKHLLSRSTDETLKLWDVKMLKKPLFVKSDLFNRFSMTDCFFSPDDKLVATGVSCQKGEEFGRLMFYQKENFELKCEMKVTKGGVIRSFWHPKLNQIFAGSSDGVVKVYYDMHKSERGAKMCVVKQKRKYRESYEMTQQQIITPHALPLFKTERKKSWRVQMMKARKDPVKSHRPELPVTGPGQGGRLASAGGTFASFIARNLGVKKRIDDTIDARQSLLRHAKDAAENPYWVSPAYSATQPKPIFAPAENEDDDDDDEPSAKRQHVPV